MENENKKSKIIDLAYPKVIRDDLEWFLEDLNKEIDNLKKDYFFSYTLPSLRDFFRDDFKKDYVCYKTDKYYVFEFEVPGFKKDEINCFLREEDGQFVLEVKASTKKDEDKSEEEKGYRKFSSQKSWKFVLPDEVNINLENIDNEIKTSLSDGILKISLPLKEEKEKKEKKILIT